MNSVFSILIIEDDTDFSDRTKEQLEDYLRDNQLIPNICLKTRYNQKDCDTIGNKYDLLIVDYNLPDNTYGTSFIDKVRAVSLLPDIIFYSSTSSIDVIATNEENNKRTSLLDLLQKGIYFSNSEKMVDVSKQVISKIILREEKINGFRGLVLSSVSEYESIVNAINNVIINRIPTEKVNALSSYCRKILEDMKNNSDKNLEEFSAEPCFEKLLDEDNRWLDHNKRTRIMNHILKELDFDQIEFEKYVSEVLKLRNSLGHVSCVQKDGQEFYSFVFENETILLTPEYCKEKRKMLLEWKARFESILDNVKRDRYIKQKDK